jgi:chromosome partitioning protein
MANNRNNMNYNEYGLNTNFMCALSGLNYSRINRAVSNAKLTPIPNSPKRNARYSISDCRSVLSEFTKKLSPVSRGNKVHSFFNFKGGTGKTSICCQVSTHLALCGYNVLVVDTDQQGNTTATMGYTDNTKYPSLYDGIEKNLPHDKLILNVFEGLDLIPANFSLVHLEKILRDKTGREYAIKRYLSSMEDKYDFIFFDCNPSVSHINRGVLTFSNHLNIVTETHPYSLQVLPVLMTDTEAYFNELELEMPKIFIIPNKYEDRSTTSAEAMSVLVKNYGNMLEPDFAVRKCEDFLKSARDHLPLSFFCKSNSIALEDISDLVRIIITHSKDKEIGELFEEVA